MGAVTNGRIDLARFDPSLRLRPLVHDLAMVTRGRARSPLGYQRPKVASEGLGDPDQSSFVDRPGGGRRKRPFVAPSIWQVAAGVVTGRLLRLSGWRWGPPRHKAGRGQRIYGAKAKV